MEGLFKFLLGLAVLIFSLTSVGIFILIVKLILLTTPEVNFMGLTMSFNLL
ncbi:MAG: hypothetical protein PF488_03690 [Patescibacteria group bacterium]|jgi:hypothetical protein|nr:hypothetical protein [Patescibacteria group bacterium]